MFVDYAGPTVDPATSELRQAQIFVAVFRRLELLHRGDVDPAPYRTGRRRTSAPFTPTSRTSNPTSTDLARPRRRRAASATRRSRRSPCRSPSCWVPAALHHRTFFSRAGLNAGIGGCRVPPADPIDRILAATLISTRGNSRVRTGSESSLAAAIRVFRTLEIPCGNGAHETGGTAGSPLVSHTGRNLSNGSGHHFGDRSRLGGRKWRAVAFIGPIAHRQAT